MQCLFLGYCHLYQLFFALHKKNQNPYVLQNPPICCFIYHVCLWQIANTAWVKNEQGFLRSPTCADELLSRATHKFGNSLWTPWLPACACSTLYAELQKAAEVFMAPWLHSMIAYPSLRQGLPINLCNRENTKSWRLLSWRPTVSSVGNCSHIQRCLGHPAAPRSSMKYIWRQCKFHLKLSGSSQTTAAHHKFDDH